MKLSAFFILLALFSCSDNVDSNSVNGNKKSKSENPFGKEPFSDTYNRNSESFQKDSASFQKDSTSYVIGFKISQQFLAQSDLSSLNKTFICKGFIDEIGSYKKEECISIIEKYMASETSRSNVDFSNQCAQSMGRLTKDEFIGKIKEIDAFYLIDEQMLNSGFKDGLNSKNIFGDNQERAEELFKKLNRILDVKQAESIEKNRKEGLDFLVKNRNKKGVKETATGIQYEVLRNGKGAYPTASSRVKVHYKGTTLSGNEFDSSYKREAPSEFGLNEVIPGWTQGIQLMRPGSKFIFYIPQDLAYGANPPPRTSIKPYSLLIFEVELLEIL
jgi:FKBP-type peptidyl-prolyl cis-trans isomerase FklB